MSTRCRHNSIVFSADNSCEDTDKRPYNEYLYYLRTLHFLWDLF